MENILNTAIEYWPYLLGLFFLAVMALNARTWFASRRSEG